MGTWNGQRLAGAAGLLFVVSILVSGFMVAPPPSPDEPATKFLAYYSDHRNVLLVQAILGLLAIIPAFVFAAGLWNLLRSEDREGGVLASAAIFSFIASGALAVLISAWFGALGYLGNGHGLTEDSAKTLSVLAAVLNQAFFAPLALTTGGSGLLLTRGTSVPRWIGWIGLAAAVLAVVGVFSVANSGVFAPFGIAFFAAFLSFAAYVAVLSVFMWRRAT